MGLHTGEPTLTADGYVGLDVHRAARLGAAGHGGQVLLSQTTRELVDQDLPAGVSLRDLGEHRLKDLVHPEPIFQLVIPDLPADFLPLRTLTIEVNRAPVLTLWAAIVAEHLGYDRAAALTLGRAVAGLHAQAYGRALGIFQPRAEAPAAEKERARKLVGHPGDVSRIEIFGRQVPVTQTSEGIRALSGNRPIQPQQVHGYLERAFGGALELVRATLEELASSVPPEELERVAYDLYEQFRPAVDPGRRGWGQKGRLDLAKIRALARRR
jgi:hypothetical protein